MGLTHARDAENAEKAARLKPGLLKLVAGVEAAHSATNEPTSPDERVALCRRSLDTIEDTDGYDGRLPFLLRATALRRFRLDSCVEHLGRLRHRLRITLLQALAAGTNVELMREYTASSGRGCMAV